MTDFDCCIDTENDTAPTTTWTKGDDTAALVRLLERAAEAGVRVTAVYDHKEWGHAVESVPDVNFEGEWTGRNYYITQDMTPVSFLVGVTSPLPPEPVRPDWLPKGAEDGGWLASTGNITQWVGGKLRWPWGSEVVSPAAYDWRVWPVWAEVKAERARLEAEVERLSTVTEEMVDAAEAAQRREVSRGLFAMSMTAALTAALAKRDEGQS